MVSARRQKQTFDRQDAMYGVSADNLRKYRTKTQNDFPDVSQDIETRSNKNFRECV